MSVRVGQVYGFLGPNGAGKTTAVKLLLGLATRTSGTGAVLGEPLGSRGARRRIGYLPELFRYQPWLGAREVLALHCELAGVERARWEREIGDVLATVGLADRATSRVGTYSKGMQQRLGLGVALIGRPALVLLDEPTSALDPVGRHDVREIIRGLRQRGTTVFLNSHLLTEVEQVCDSVAIIDRGRVVAEGEIPREASRRRLLFALVALTLVVIALTVWGFSRIADLRTGGQPLPPVQQTAITSQLLILVMFMFSQAVMLSSAFVAAPAISAEVESGISLALLARPLARAEDVLGKWVGA